MCCWPLPAAYAVDATPGEIRQNHGLSSGVMYMLNHGITADFAITCKPGWAAAWEEVGLCWFKVTVQGQMGYAGMTRSFPNFRMPLSMRRRSSRR